MALAFANQKEVVDLPGGGPRGTRIVTVDVTLDTSYPTGGSAGLVAGAGLGAVSAVVFITEGGYSIDYIIATDKLKVYQQPAAASAGAMPEVPNTTNLSGVTVKALVIGT